MKTLIVTVGLPRSGKSTWAREYSKKHGIPHVSSDSVRMAFYGHPFIREAEPWVWPQIRVMVKALFIAGHDTVIIDSTCTAKRDREWWRDNMWEIKFKPFTTSPEICLARAKKDEEAGINPPGLVLVLQQKLSTYETLTEEELKQELKG